MWIASTADALLDILDREEQLPVRKTIHG